jgi:6-phosphogluconate dehydrogenase
MQLGMIGLGRMGSNIVRRLQRGGHTCVVYDRNADAVATLAAEGATGSTSIADFVGKLDTPRAVWLMVPAGITGAVLDEVAAAMDSGDIIIDGGNSNYRDDVARAAALGERRIEFVDCGTSGGVWGLERGFCLMIGANDATFAHLEPIFRTLAPGVDAAPRTPGRTGDPSMAEQGYLHCGPPGAGHFVKMVHNGIEYAVMGAYAEGLNVLHHANAGKRGTAEFDAETAPLREPQLYQYDIDVADVTEVWRRGSVIASWLLDLTASSLHESPDLSEYSARVSDSGEGRWTLEAAIDEGVPAPLIANALFNRFSSRGAAEFADRVLSAMRSQFGGHGESPTTS